MVQPEIRVFSYSTEKDLEKLKKDLTRAINSGKIPVFIDAFFDGTLYAPSKGKPWFRLSLILPAEIFKDFDKEQLKKTGFSIGLDHIYDLRLFLFAFIPREKLNPAFLETKEEKQ